MQRRIDLSEAMVSRSSEFFGAHYEQLRRLGDNITLGEANPPHLAKNFAKSGGRRLCHTPSPSIDIFEECSAWRGNNSSASSLGVQPVSINSRYNCSLGP